MITSYNSKGCPVISITYGYVSHTLNMIVIILIFNLKWFNSPTLWVGKKIKVPLSTKGSLWGKGDTHQKAHIFEKLSISS